MLLQGLRYFMATNDEDISGATNVTVAFTVFNPKNLVHQIFLVPIF